MADTKREIERKYEATDATRLPDLSRVAGVTRPSPGVTELDAVYYDTPASASPPTPSPCAAGPAGPTRAGT